MIEPNQSRSETEPLEWDGGAVVVKADGAIWAANSSSLADSVKSASALHLSDFACKLLAHAEIKAAIADVATRDGLSSPVRVEISVSVDNERVTAVVRRLESRDGPLALVTFQIEPAPSDARDALTGLPDRRALAAWAGRRQRGGSPVAVLFIDLDDFKRINDAHGHAAGDRVLEELARRWGQCIRDDDLLARYGGDEFVVLLDGVCTGAEAEPVVGRLREATRRPMKLGETTIQLTATIGVAVLADPATSLEALIAEADRDMYARKPPRGV